MTMDQIPDKLYFKIGEVARVTKIKPYILRYWESEFNIISPDKSRGNQRIYKRKDVELIIYIKNLLYRDKFSLEGAKKKVKEFRKEKDKQMPLPFGAKEYMNALEGIKKDLVSIRDMIKA
ncbi:MAG: MerR family transcriptional regulator [Thermodesulfobacteriota bacterium]